jgi:hypothetical protein
MPRALALAAALAFTLTAVVPAAADDAPDAAKVKRAAEEFDLGRSTYKAKQYEEAAQHFEAADEAVPNVKVLRLAIRARSEAGHGSRAATLAAQALERYPDDADTAALAKETLAKFEAGLHKVKVSCASPCLLAVGTRTVHGARATRWTVYLDPGKASLNASFLGDTSAKPRAIDAAAGGSSDLRFEPPEPSKPVTPAPTATTTASASPTSTATSAPTAGPAPTGAPDQPAPKKGLHPAFFGVSLGLTAAAGGVLAWSGVDTLQNPGPDRVRQACAGKGPDCPEYKLGLDNQLRTNILIGATAGMGAVTVLLAVFTRWSGADPVKKTGLVPTVAVLDRGAALGVTGAIE